MLDPCPPERLARVLGVDGEVAERPACRVARVAVTHPGGNVPLGLAIEMVRELLLKLGVSDRAPAQRAKSRGETSHHAPVYRHSYYPSIGVFVIPSEREESSLSL